jgi:16S rRNA (cytosine967-C5)-methyltransferase
VPDSTETPVPSPARRLAFGALKAIYQGGFADTVLHRYLQRTPLIGADRALATELVYGIVRRQRTLDALIDQLGTKKARQQPLDLRIILHLGLYQLRYLSQIPPSAAVNTSVELAKTVGLTRLAGVVNGILRQYLRQQEAGPDPLQLPSEPIGAIAVAHSYPDWLVTLWREWLGDDEAAALADWMNQPPTLDLRIHSLRATVEQVEAALQAAAMTTRRLAPLPHALRLVNHAGAIHALPGYQEGWWTVQDASAQWVSHLVNPQPGQVVIDACAAPGGKTAHLAALMGDAGTVWACDRTASRLKKIRHTVKRLGLQCVQPCWRTVLNWSALRGRAIGSWWMRPVLGWEPCTAMPMQGGGKHPNPSKNWPSSSANCWTGPPHGSRPRARWCTQPAPCTPLKTKIRSPIFSPPIPTGRFNAQTQTLLWEPSVNQRAGSKFGPTVIRWMGSLWCA